MKKLFMFLMVILFFGFMSNINSQSLTLCERYDTEKGMIGAGSQFTTGYLTVVVQSNQPMYYDEVFIQYDRLVKGKYVFYKKFPFKFPNGYKTVYFSRSGNNDMEFNHAGYYNVFMLDRKGNVIASNTVTIINR